MNNSAVEIANEAVNAIDRIYSSQEWRTIVIGLLDQWIPCSDRLPANGQFVLCWHPNIFDVWRRDSGEAHTGTGHHKNMVVRQLVAKDGVRWADEGVTHWQPIPPPPAPTKE